MVQPCQICGDPGNIDEIVICSKCHKAREHIYCMNQKLNHVPKSWHCEACRHKRDHRETSYSDGPRRYPEEEVGDSSKKQKTTVTGSISCKVPDVSKVNGASSFKTTGHFASRSFVPKKVETRKVKYLSHDEVRPSGPKQKPYSLQGGSSSEMGSSGINQYFNPKRTPLNVVAFPKVSIEKDHIYTASSPKPITVGKVHTSILQKQTMKPLHDLKSRSRYTCESSPSENLRHAVIPNIREKEHTSEALLSPVSHRVPAVSGIPEKFECENPLSGWDKHAGKVDSLLSQDGVCKEGPVKAVMHSAEDRVSNSKVSPRVGEEDLPNPPAIHHALWKGSFEIPDYSNEICGEFQAYPPERLSRKAYSASKKMPKVLKVTLQPWRDVWPFTKSPSGYDIALYFWAEDFCRVTYDSLLEHMKKENLSMRSRLNGVDLLIFTSKELQCESQRINKQFYLWGVFLRSPVDEGGDNAINVPLQSYEVGETSSSVPLEADDRLQQPVEKDTVPRHLPPKEREQHDAFDIPPGFSNSDDGPGFSTLTTTNTAGAGPATMSPGKMSPGKMSPDVYESDSPPGFSELTKPRVRDASSKGTAPGLERDSTTVLLTGNNRFDLPRGSSRASDRSCSSYRTNFRAKNHVRDPSAKDKGRHVEPVYKPQKTLSTVANDDQSTDFKIESGTTASQSHSQEKRNGPICSEKNERRDSFTAQLTGKNRFDRPRGSSRASDRSFDGFRTNFRAKTHVWHPSRKYRGRSVERAVYKLQKTPNTAANDDRSTDFKIRSGTSANQSHPQAQRNSRSWSMENESRDSVTAQKTGKNRFDLPWGLSHSSDRSCDDFGTNFRARNHVSDPSEKDMGRHVEQPVYRSQETRDTAANDDHSTAFKIRSGINASQSHPQEQRNSSSWSEKNECRDSITQLTGKNRYDPPWGSSRARDRSCDDFGTNFRAKDHVRDPSEKDKGRHVEPVYNTQRTPNTTANDDHSMDFKIESGTNASQSHPQEQRNSRSWSEKNVYRDSFTAQVTGKNRFDLPQGSSRASDRNYDGFRTNFRARTRFRGRSRKHKGRHQQPVYKPQSTLNTGANDDPSTDSNIRSGTSANRSHPQAHINSRSTWSEEMSAGQQECTRANQTNAEPDK